MSEMALRIGRQRIALGGPEQLRVGVVDRRGQVGGTGELRRVARHLDGDAQRPFVARADRRVRARGGALPFAFLQQLARPRPARHAHQRVAHDRIHTGGTEAVAQRKHRISCGWRHRRHGIRAIHALVREALLERDRHAHEAHLRVALHGLHARQPEALVVEPVLDRDAGDVGLHRRHDRPHRHRAGTG